MKRINIKKYIKKSIPFILVGVLASSAVIGTYSNAREVKAVAVVDDITIIVAILAICGVGIAIPTWQGDHWSGDGPIDDETADAFKDWWKKLGGKAGASNADLDAWMHDNGYMDADGNLTDAWYHANGQKKPSGGGSGDNDNNDSDLWKSIKKSFKDASDKGVPINIAVGSALGTVLALASSSFIKDSEKGKYLDATTSNITIPQEILDKNFKYCAHYKRTDGLQEIERLYFSNVAVSGCENLSEGKVLCYSFFGAKELWCEYNLVTGSITWLNDGSTFGTGAADYLKWRNGVETGVFSSNYPMCSTYEEYEEKRKQILESGLVPNLPVDYPSAINPDTVTPTTELNNQSNPLIQPLHNTVTVPSLEQLLQIITQLQNTTDSEIKQQIKDQFVTDITTDTEIEPKPDTKPDTNPDTEVGEDTLTEEQKNKFLLPESIKKKFPFCIPFDLIDAFSLLKSSSREAPYIEFPIKSERFNIDYIFVIDFNDFNDIAVLLRSLLLLVFIVGLVLGTRSLIRG